MWAGPAIAAGLGDARRHTETVTPLVGFPSIVAPTISICIYGRVSPCHLWLRVSLPGSAVQVHVERGLLSVASSKSLEEMQRGLTYYEEYKHFADRVLQPLVPVNFCCRIGEIIVSNKCTNACYFLYEFFLEIVFYICGKLIFFTSLRDNKQFCMNTKLYNITFLKSFGFFLVFDCYLGHDILLHNNRIYNV